MQLMITNMTNNCSMNCTMRDIERLLLEYQENNQAGDATWILTSSFIIFTMQSGFGLLEAGIYNFFRF